MLVDSHAHIYSEYYDDIDKVVKDAKDNYVERIINCSTNLDNCKEVIEVSNKHGFYYALGIHPEEIENFNGEITDKLNEIIMHSIEDKRFIAIGEIGLDYHYNPNNKEEQKKLFEEELSLAEKYNKPVIIHSRDATLDTINILKKYRLKGVIHCYSGSLETAREYIKLGYKLGIGGVITFKNCNLKDYIKKIGIENIILETDSPYMTPEPYRGQKNEPKYVLETAKFVSKIFDIPLEKICKKTTENCKEIFDIEA